MYKVIPVPIQREPTLSADELQEFTHVVGLMAETWSDYFKRYYDKIYNKAKTYVAPARPAPPVAPSPTAPPAADEPMAELLITVRDINEKFQRLLELLPELHRPQYGPVPQLPEPPQYEPQQLPEAPQERRLAFYRA